MRWDSSTKDCTENCPILTLKLVQAYWGRDCAENCPILTLKLVQAYWKGLCC